MAGPHQNQASGCNRILKPPAAHQGRPCLLEVRKRRGTTAVFGGDGGFCALLSTSRADRWGYGAAGQLRDGSTNSSDVPLKVGAVGEQPRHMGVPRW
jgi:hypothetical protein